MNATPESLHKKFVYDEMREHIIAQIRDGVLKPHDALLSEQKLSKRYGISLGSVQKAVKQLQEQGWVYRKVGSGTFVCDALPVKVAMHAKEVVMVEGGFRERDAEHASFRGEILYPLENRLFEMGIQSVRPPYPTDRLWRFLEEEADRIGVVVLVLRAGKIFGIVKELSLPCVAIINMPDMDMGACFDGIASDDLAGAYDATRHLIAAGHVAICHLGGRRINPTARDRLAGYRKAMQEAGIRENPGYLASCDWTIQGGYESMLKILASGGSPTAVFAANDFIAFGAMKAIRESGRNVPDDVSVVGYDDWMLAKHMEPPLTTVYVDRARFGGMAARMIQERLANPDRPGRIERVTPELLERESVRALS